MNLIDFFNKIYISHELSDSGKNAETFISIAEKVGINSFDKEIICDYRSNPFLIEEEIKKIIISSSNIDINIYYATFFTRTMNAYSQFHDKDQSSIVIDELLIHSLLTFFITVASVSCNYSLLDEGCELLHRLFSNQITQKEIDSELTERASLILLKLSSEAINNIMDYFWCAYTFLIGHEVYHIIFKSGNDKLQDELEADSFGYKSLITLILLQKCGKLKQSIINIYYEHNYLAPVFLFEYYQWKNLYQKSQNKDYNKDKTHPSPEVRSNNILEMFDYLPDDFNTKEGNDILASLLDASDDMKARMSFLGLI